MSNFSRGRLPQPPLEVAGQRVAVNICYEDVFGEEISRQLSTPEAATDRALMADLGRELSRLEPIVAALREWRTVLTRVE